MPKILNNLDLVQNQLQNVVIHNAVSLSSITSPIDGQVVYITGGGDAGKVFVRRLGAWKELGEIESLSMAVDDDNLVTISNTAGAYTLDLNTQITPTAGSSFLVTDPSGDLQMPLNGSINVTGTGDITIGGISVATTADVTAAINGLNPKDSVRLKETDSIVNNTSISLGTATYNNIGGTSGRGQITATLSVSGVYTVDSVNVNSGDRILLASEASGLGADANGIWVATISGTSLTLDRATDFDEDFEVTANTFVFIEEGAIAQDTSWVLVTDNPIQIGGVGGTALSWSQFSGPGTFTGGNGIDISSNFISIDLVTTDSGLKFNAGKLELDIATNGGLDKTGGLQLASTVAGAGLALTSGVLDVGTGDGINVLADSIEVDVTDFIDTTKGLTESANDIQLNANTTSFQFNGTTGALELNPSVAGNGILLSANILSVDVDTSGAISNNFLSGGKLGVNTDDTTIEINSNSLRVKPNGITTTQIADGTILAGDINTTGTASGDGVVSVSRKWVDTFNGLDSRFNGNDIVLVHNLATTEVSVTVLDENSEIVYVDVVTNTATDTTQGNEITIFFTGGSKPGNTETYTAVIIG